MAYMLEGCTPVFLLKCRAQGSTVVKKKEMALLVA
jgi:hypothetical protein